MAARKRPHHFTAQGLAENHPVHFIRDGGDALIQDARAIAKFAGEGVIRHDAAADFIGHEDHVPRGLRGLFQRVDFAIASHCANMMFESHSVRQSTTMHVDFASAISRAAVRCGSSMVGNSCAALRSMVRDALGHFFIARLARSR